MEGWKLPCHPGDGSESHRAGPGLHHPQARSRRPQRAQVKGRRGRGAPRWAKGPWNSRRRLGPGSLLSLSLAAPPPTPPGWEPGSCGRKERSKAIRVLVTMANAGEKKKCTQTVLVLDTQAHGSGEAGRLHPHVRAGTCGRVCACVGTCGRVCAPVHAWHMHTIASKETASLERGWFFEFQLAVSTMSV